MIAKHHFNFYLIFKIFDSIEPQLSNLYVLHKKHFTLLNSSICNLNYHLTDILISSASSYMILNRNFWPTQLLAGILLKITSIVELKKTRKVMAKGTF